METIRLFIAYPSEHYYSSPGTSRIDLLGLSGELPNGGLLEQTFTSATASRRSAEFVVLNHGMPCFKLGIRFDRRVL